MKTNTTIYGTIELLPFDDILLKVKREEPIDT
jgi:hypothetical protein